MSKINFFLKDIDYNLRNKNQIKSWLREIIKIDGQKQIKSINYIFCSDPYLLTLNQKYLHHTTLTDILTFNLSENDHEIESEIYISIDRVRDNSERWKVSFDEELKRVLAHGILHLLGYGDKTEEEKKIMRQKENECLNLL